MQCKFCNKECKSLNSLRNHERLCKLNPNRDISDMAAARAKATRPISCVHCTKIFPWNTIRKHENICLSKDRVCPECNNDYRANSTEQVYCSNKCANNATKYKPRKDNNYRTLCFRFHKKECVVCGFDKVISVHHYDENKKNNHPLNLIPMCPNHHEMIHTKSYVDEVKPIVDKWLLEQKLSGRFPE